MVAAGCKAVNGATQSRVGGEESDSKTDHRHSAAMAAGKRDTLAVYRDPRAAHFLPNGERSANNF